MFPKRCNLHCSVRLSISSLCLSSVRDVSLKTTEVNIMQFHVKLALTFSMVSSTAKFERGPELGWGGF